MSVCSVVVMSPYFQRGLTALFEEGQTDGNEVVRGMVKGLVVHYARGVVSTSSPIFASAYLRLPITSRLFDAESHGNEGIVVRSRE